MNKILILLLLPLFTFAMDKPATRVMLGDYCLTKHAQKRIRERKIGQGVLLNALEKGKRFSFDDDTQFCIYEPDNIIAVIKQSRNLVITAYQERNSEHCKQRIERLKLKLAGSPDGILYKKKTATYTFDDIAKKRMEERGLDRQDVLDIIFKGKPYPTYTGGTLHVDFKNERAVHTSGHTVVSVFTGITKAKVNVWKYKVALLNARAEKEIAMAKIVAGTPTAKSLRKQKNKPLIID